MSAQAALKLKATSLGKAPLKPSKIHTMKSAYPVNHVKVDEKFSINKDKSTGSKNECQNLRKFSAVSEDISAMVENKCCLCGTSVSLKEKNLVIKDNDDVCCIKCIEEEMAVKCSKCKQSIRDGCINYKDMLFHSECFICKNCEKPLSNERFQSRGKVPYCLLCYEKLFANHCVACKQPILRLAKCMILKGRSWHSECFKCTKCEISLVGKSFLNDLNGIACSNCIDEKKSDLKIEN